jgi:hypothetical protein
MSIRARLLISIGISLAAVLVPLMVFNAAPGYGTMALALIVWFPGIVVARLFLPPAPPRIAGIDFIVAAISFAFYTWLPYLLLGLYSKRRG